MAKTTYESWVAGFVERLSDYFNLAGWEIEIEYTSKNEGGVCADISIDSSYLSAVLTMHQLSKDYWDKGDLYRLSKILVHELVHIFYAPFLEHANRHLSEATRPAFVDVLERQTQSLTMVFLKTLPKSISSPR